MRCVAARRDLLVEAEDVAWVPVLLERLEPGEGDGAVGMLDTFCALVTEEVRVFGDGATTLLPLRISATLRRLPAMTRV